MEYVHAALILHEAGQEIDEDNLEDVLEAAGVAVNESRVKALVAALDDVDIEEALQQPAVPTGGAPSEAEAPSETEEVEAETEMEAETEEEDEQAEEAAAEGLGDLFG